MSSRRVADRFPIMTRGLSFLLLAAATAACRDAPRTPLTARRSPQPPRPDELPVLVTGALPFKYPAELYARKVQGNVTLKLFIDRDGHVLEDSTRIDEPSGYPSLDSAALRGAGELRFVPAKLHGEPVPVSILFPVYFRHPEAGPLPGDTILRNGRSG
jgi:protein TonB